MDRVLRGVIRNEIINELKKGNNVAVIAFTGWGKTRMAFEVAIELARQGHRVGVLFPTLTVALKKWEEFLSLLQNVNPPPTAILTGGAQQFCIYRWQYPQRFCGRCSLRRSWHATEMPPKTLTYSELDKIVPDDTCGYWAQEELFPQYHIVLGHYGRAAKIMPFVNYVVWDEAQELFIPSLQSIPLSHLAALLSTDVSELRDIEAIRDYAEAKLIGADPLREDEIHSLLQMLNRTCWIEDSTLHCLETRKMPSGIPSLMLTATPPPGWPPEGWGRKIEIQPLVKPRAFIEPEAKFFYRNNYEGIGLQIHLVIQWLKKKFGAKCIIIFATSSVQHIIKWSLPIDVSHEPPEDEMQIPPSGVVVADAWGRLRVGVDIRWCDAAVLTWPSLHITARRRLRAEGKNPDIAELLLSVQHAGRIMRPRPGETYEHALEKRIVTMIDGRFWHHREYLERFFTIEELPQNLS
jgi:hypothetical protein